MRKPLSILSLALAVSILALGIYGEYVASQPDEPFFGPDQFFVFALFISFVPFLVSYILWPKRS